MGSPKKKPSGDPTYALRIISIINKMRNSKQRASLERITYYMGHYYGVSESDTIQELNGAINSGLIMKFIGLKGKESYRDAKFPRLLPSHSFVKKHSADLRMLVAMAIESIDNPSGSKIRVVEEYIRTNHPLDLSRADITSQLKLAVAHGVSDGLFIRNGPNIKVVSERCEELKQKDNQSLFADGVEPSPVCGFCLGTSESNKTKHPEQLLSCVDCGNSGHPSCLKFSPELTRQCMSEPWQCIECKVCSFCRQSGDAENLLFCDSCDKGFHMDCLLPPMKEMPKGFWMCCLCQRTPADRGRKRKKAAPIFSSPEPESEIKILSTEKKPKKRVIKTAPAQCEREVSESDLMSDVKIIQGIVQAEEKKKVKLKKKNKVLNKLLNVHEDESEDNVFEEEPKSKKIIPKKTYKRKEVKKKKVVDAEVAVILEETRTEVCEFDKKLYERITEKCNKALKISPVETAGERLPKVIDFGKYELETWYSSPLPFEYSRLEKLYFCEFCLKYMKSKEATERHGSKCMLRQPPATEIYRHNDISLYEVDGAKNKLYCRNLCLLAKMFLDHKTLYYDVEPFLFYVLTSNDSYGSHMVGYFSKEKVSIRPYNLSCIMTLPHTQRKGYGKLLIDFSYVLSRLEGKPGTPEKPLSDLGLISYRSYWRSKVLHYIADSKSSNILVTDISKATGMLYEDVVLALHDLKLLDYDDKCEEIVLEIDQQLILDYIQKRESSKHHIINEDALLWSPIINTSYGVASQRRMRKSGESSQSAPQKMLLSPMKVVKNVDKVDVDEPAVEEPRPIDTFTKYYPNWIPAGEDADEYRYAGDQEKGEIESFVMRKTPGKKKRVKFAVIYNPKSGKRFTRAIPQKKKGPSAKSKEPVSVESISENGIKKDTSHSKHSVKKEEPLETEEHLEEPLESEEPSAKEVKLSNSPVISCNEISSTSDNVVVSKDTKLEESSEPDCELPHSTTDPEYPAPMTPDACSVSNLELDSSALPFETKKRQHSSESESSSTPSGKKVKIGTPSSLIEYTDSESDDDDEIGNVGDISSEQNNGTNGNEINDEDDASKEDDDNFTFLNTFSNIYVKTPDCSKASENNSNDSRDSLEDSKHTFVKDPSFFHGTEDSNT